MFHKASFWWFMVTQYITSIGLFYKKVGILLGGVSDCEELVVLYNTFIFPSLYNENGEELITSGTFM